MIAALFLVALAFGEEPSNIEASRMFEGDIARVVQVLSDPEQIAQRLPARCGRVLSTDGRGKDASFRIVYTMAWWKRRLDADVTRANTDEGVEWDHRGNRGFITRWRIVDEGDQQRLVVTTWMNPPPWPFKKYYFKTIKPRWELCYREMLDGLLAN